MINNPIFTSENESLQTIVISKNEQVEEWQSMLESMQERKSYVSFTINETSKRIIILEERSVKTNTDKTSQTEELQNAVGNNDVHLEELKLQRETIRELEVTIQEMKQVEETRKISSLVLQNSSNIIPLSGYNNYKLIS